MSTLTALFGVLGAVGGVGGIATLAYIGRTRQKIGAEARKIGVEADDVISGRAMEMYDRVLKELNAAKARQTSLEELVGALRDHVDVLESLMRANNLTPPRFVAPAPVVVSEEP